MYSNWNDIVGGWFRGFQRGFLFVLPYNIWCDSSISVDVGSCTLLYFLLWINTFLWKPHSILEVSFCDDFLLFSLCIIVFDFDYSVSSFSFQILKVHFRSGSLPLHLPSKQYQVPNSHPLDKSRRNSWLNYFNLEKPRIYLPPQNLNIRTEQLENWREGSGEGSGFGSKTNLVAHVFNWVSPIYQNAFRRMLRD